MEKEIKESLLKELEILNKNCKDIDKILTTPLLKSNEMLCIKNKIKGINSLFDYKRG